MIRTLIAFVLVCATSAACLGEVILHDHFDDGVLDPDWVVELDNAWGWTYIEQGSDLLVTDIPPRRSGWAEVILTRTAPGAGDLDVDWRISWDSEGSEGAMQHVFLRLYATDSTYLAGAGYTDPWYSYRGKKWGRAGDSSYLSDDYLPLTGNASVHMQRIGDTMTVAWDGDVMVSGMAVGDLGWVEMQFGFYNSSSLPSFFGSESVDVITVNAEGAITNVRGRSGTEVVISPSACLFFPNPMTPPGMVSFRMPTAGHFVLSVFDVGGRHVRKLLEGEVDAGAHTMHWDGLDKCGVPLPSGMYFFALDMANGRVREKVLLLR